MPQYNRLMAFDFGTKKIGIATGQTVTQAATPLTSIHVHHGQLDWKKLDHLLATHQPEALVVGLPLNMDGTTQTITTLAKAFANQLESHYRLPVFLMDERLTTVSARDEIFTQGGYKALKASNVDAYAAKLILESWMHSYPDPSSKNGKDD